jgi:ribosomal protein L32
MNINYFTAVNLQKLNIFRNRLFKSNSDLTKLPTPDEVCRSDGVLSVPHHLSLSSQHKGEKCREVFINVLEI